jgi:hypothetical protein
MRSWRVACWAFSNNKSCCTCGLLLLLLLLPALLLQMGDIGNAGKCTHACGGCTVCAAGDKDCYNENRRKAGFLVYEEDDLDSDRVLNKTSGSA